MHLNKDYIALRMSDYGLPDYMVPGVQRYLLDGVVPGDFLCGIIENNLAEAVRRADDTNVTMLVSWVQFFYNEAPASSWGSRDAIDYWRSRDFTEDNEAQDERQTLLEVGGNHAT